MGVLNTFYYVFSANADALDKGLQQSEKKANDLKKTVSATDKNVEKLGKSFVSLAKAATGLLGATLTLGGIKLLTLNVAESTSALGQQARQIGVNVSSLDAWRKSVTQSGGDAEAFTRTLSKLGQRFRDPEQALLRYSQVLGRVDSRRAFRLGRAIGLDDSTIELLRKGRGAVEDLIRTQREQGVITKQQVEQADKFNNDLRKLKGSFTDLKTQIGIMFLPVLQYLLDKFFALSRWATKNKGPIKDVFLVAAGIVTAVYLPAMLRAAAATIAATWPILLIAGIIALLALAVADVIGYFKGWDSVTGDLVKRFPALGGALETLRVIVLDIWNWLTKLFNDPIGAAEELALAILAFPVNALRDLLNLVFGEELGGTIFDTLKTAAIAVGKIFDGVAAAIKAVINIAIKGFEKIGNAWRTFKGWFGLDSGPAINGGDPQLISNAAQYIAQASTSPVGAMTSGAIQNSRAVNNSQKTDVRIDSVEINTQATDAEGVARDFANFFTDLVDQNNNGFTS